MSKYSLRTGDLLLVFSDGVLDLFDGTLDSLTRAAEVANGGAQTAQDSVARIVELASRSEKDDDVTVIAVRRVA